MSKSIASKALAIAKKREEIDLKLDYKYTIKILKHRRIISCEPWESSDVWETLDNDEYYEYAQALKNFNIKDLKQVCEEVGFSLLQDSTIGTFLSIPKWVKGQKLTQAQKMLYWSNIEIKRKIKSRKDAAKKMCKEALEKIKNGDFVSSYVDYSYQIEVKVSYSEDNKEFRDEVASFFEKKKFTLLGIDAKSNTWNFTIEAS